MSMVVRPIKFRAKGIHAEIGGDDLRGTVSKREFPIDAALDSDHLAPFLRLWREYGSPECLPTLADFGALWQEPDGVGLHLIETNDGPVDTWRFLRFDARVATHGRDLAGTTLGDYPNPLIRVACNMDLHTAARLRRPSLIEIGGPVGGFLRLLLPLRADGHTERAPVLLMSIVQLTQIGVGGRRPRRGRSVEHRPPEQMSDAELLAEAIGSELPSAAAHALAIRLLETFGTAAGVLQTRTDAFLRVPGASRRIHVRLRAAAELGRRSVPVGSNACAVFLQRKALIDHVVQRISGQPTEELWVFHFDTRDRLVRQERHSKGTVDYVQFFNRELVASILDSGATSIILAHNHPSGIPEPSREDVVNTNHAAEYLIRLRVHLKDHIIVGGGSYVSLRERGVLKY
ncbi:MAG TPA: JAB domain-containing protein [Azospirillaceae bacterium]|nr:JAB domain-containing protein [Azospirillaceae bacterium]